MNDQEIAVESEAVALRTQGLNPDVLNELMERCEPLRHELRSYDGLDGASAASEVWSKNLLDEMRRQSHVSRLCGIYWQKA